MELHKLIKQELERGFTKSELERIWDLPKNCLSAVLNVESKVKLSKKAEVRVKAYFDGDPINRPDPSPRIARKGKVVGAVSLPKDYVQFTEVAVLNEDGSTTPLNEIVGMGGGNKVISDAINELLTFGTATVKTELVDGKVKSKVVDKNKIVDEDAEWKPKLSPFMLSRQKTKGGGSD